MDDNFTFEMTEDDIIIIRGEERVSLRDLCDEAAKAIVGHMKQNEARGG